MTAIHNPREYSEHKHEVIRPTYEYLKVELFSYDHELTQITTPSKITKGENYKLVNHRHLKAIVCKDTSPFVVTIPYNVKTKGQYRIDILYENKNSKDLVGKYEIQSSSSKVKYLNSTKITSTEKQITKLEKQIKEIKDKINTTKQTIKDKKSSTKAVSSAKLNLKTLEKQLKTLKKKLANNEKTLESTHRINGSDVKFDGEKDWLKRKTIFKNLDVGKQNLSIELPYNCYFLGTRITRVITLTGDITDSPETVLMLKDVEFTLSNKADPVEAKVEIGYNNLLENSYSDSGYYFNYADEINIYAKETADANDLNIIRRFGGYVTSWDINEDKSNLTLNCSDRLQDGEAKYMLATMLILEGTSDKTKDTEKYYKPISFNTYGQALKYICDAYELTLKSNISKNYLVAGEKYHTGLSLKFGKKKDIKKVATSNAKATMQKNFVTVRNNSSGKKKQSITLYNAKDHVKKYPVCLREIGKDSFLTFHMTYGLGDPKTESKSTTITSKSSGTGSQNFSKCGVSADKKYVMAIGTVSSARDSGHYGTYYKTTFKNKCPHCGKATLRWDSCRSDTKCIYTQNWGGSKRSWGVAAIETEITCNSCDSDFSALGNEKDSPWKKLTKVGSTVKSSKSEQTKLHKGKMEGVAKSGVKLSPETVLKEVANVAKKYKYELGTTSSYSAMKKAGKGDCWAFSDLLFTELKKRKVNCRILQYGTSYASNHRSVQYQNSKNEWVSFPYKKYGLSTMLVQTSNWKSGLPALKTYKGGGNIASVTSSKSKTTSTTTVTTTKGYDRDKPIQCYIEICFSTEKSLKAKQYKINLDFTLKAGTNNDWSGLPNYWVNNAQRRVSVDMSGFFDDNFANKNIYLQSIRLVTPKAKKSSNNENTNWYTYDKSTHDNSSCKMDLYQIIFDDRPAINPEDLQSTGKTLNSILEDIVKEADYTVRREYGKHRKDDKIFFGLNNATKTKFTATEGDDNNILEWTNISYKPVSDLKNKTICVFKNSSNEYNYVDTGDIKSIVQYGEQTTLKTISDQIGAKEAYFNAKNSEDYNPIQSFSYTVVVPYAPNLNIDDLVEVISNRKVLNDVKPIKSIKVQWNNDKKPSIQTEIGLDELEPYLRIKKEQEKLRKNAKAKTTYFGRTATAIEDENIYIWEN